MSEFADLTLGEIVAAVASRNPTPGAGPVLAWTCALAAGQVEMVCAVMLAREPDAAAVREREGRRERAAALRETAMSLAERDAAAYTEVLAVQRRREEPGHAQRLRQALADAADPLVAIVDAAREVGELAAAAIADARGGVRGEAITALVLAESVARAGVPLVELNLAGLPEDARREQVREAASAVTAGLRRALG
jgi:methenyltetrahydrofolate cyclohydrolase